MQHSDAPATGNVSPVVLLLEDNADYRALLTEVLTLSGFEVYAAPDGRRVDEMLRARRIDLVITDVSMPERDGLETMSDLRQSHPQLPVIAISGDVPLNRDLFLEIAAKLGASRVLAKPFRIDELIAAAREAVGIAIPPATPPT
jgi:CheY-like chemotaxis protein